MHDSFNEEAEEIDLEIRPVTPEDFDMLTDISRVCFPEQLRWRIRKSHSRKWWENLINSNNSEIWVGSVYGQPVAFIAFVFERQKYEDAWNTQRFTFLDSLSIFASSPKRFIKKIFMKLKLHKTNKLQNKESSKGKKKKNVYEEVTKTIAKNNPWCGPIAVLPSIRGKGVSLKMIEHCCRRAKSLGYKEIYTAVQKKNMMSRIMVAIADFNVIKEIDRTLFYKKILENNDKRVNSTR